MERGSGVLLHISSLPGEYMSGQIDKEAYRFVDFLKKAKVKYWQILPLAPTSYGDSPYQSCSSFSVSEYFISLDKLCEQGLLTAQEIDKLKVTSSRVDYSFLYDNHFAILKKAFSRFDKSDSVFLEFCSSEEVMSYAEFRVVKTLFEGKPLCEWAKEYKNYQGIVVKKYLSCKRDEILFWCFCQYIVQEQWLALKKYANDSGVLIIGDMPIYVSGDSVEVWKNPKYFVVDSHLNPKLCAGVPPDCFSSMGQLWGNPVYNYKRMKKSGYAWWLKRIEKAMQFCDLLRIDHFRGFSQYYAINAKYHNARIGRWYNAPGKAIFTQVKEKFSGSSIIGEDLGFIDKKAREFFDFVGYPGMKIIQFGFDGNPSNEHLPTNCSKNFLMYTGTHDNEPLIMRIKSLLATEKDRFIASLKTVMGQMNLEKKTDFADENQLADIIIEMCYMSPCNVCVIPMQDLLHQDKESRMNLPSTVSTDNWSYRIQNEVLSSKLLGRLKSLNEAFNR